MRHHHLPARHAVIALAAGMLLFAGCAAAPTADIPPAARPAALAAPTTFSVTVTTELTAPSTPPAQPKHLAYTGSGVIDTTAHTAELTIGLPAGVQLELREVGDRLYLDQTPHGATPGWLATPAPAAGQQPDPWQLATRCTPAPLSHPRPSVSTRPQRSRWKMPARSATPATPPAYGRS